MAKKKKAAPAAAASEFPSGDVLAELKTVLKERNAKKRSQAAWRQILRAAPNNDFPVVMDFALENGLIHALDDAAKQLENGQRALSIIWTNPIDGSEMVWVPPGPFCVGANKNRAECAGFSLARYPVTNAQFEQFLEATSYQPVADHPDSELFLHHWTKERKPPKAKETHPVVFVSYVDALHYCHWAGMQLPTEWQWEKAARGPEGRPFPWGTDTPGYGNKLANVRSKGTCAVGQYSRVRTPYGCEDMIGNVSEWCHMTDGDAPGFVPAPLSAGGPSMTELGGHTAVRGSCFLRFDPKLMKSEHRRRLAKIRRNYWTGFRPAFLQSWCPAEP
jgi:serine/threonine-protein kinase